MDLMAALRRSLADDEAKGAAKQKPAVKAPSPAKAEKAAPVKTPRKRAS